MMKRMGWKRAAALASIVVIVVVTLTFPNASRATARATLFVVEVVFQPKVSPLRLVTQRPLAQPMVFPYANGMADGVAYWPRSTKPHPAIILSPGYLPGLSDPLLDRVAETLARLDIAVLIPRTPNLRQGLLLPEDVEVLIGAFLWLAEQPTVDSDRVGFAGFCVGSSIALVAAADARINEQVAFIHVFGGYYDARSAFRAIAAHSVQTSEGEIAWQPAPQAVSLFVANVLRHIRDDNERQAIGYAIAKQSHLQTSGLSPLAQQAYQLLTLEEPGTIDAVLVSLPSHIQAQFDAVSPAHSVSRVRAKVFIIHDKSDPYVPAFEAARLAAALPAISEPRLAYYELFNHVRPNRATDWFTLARETGRLVIHLAQLFLLIDS